MKADISEKFKTPEDGSTGNGDSGKGNSDDHFKAIFDNNCNVLICTELHPHPELLGFKDTGRRFSTWPIYALGDRRVVFNQVDETQGYWEAAYTMEN